MRRPAANSAEPIVSPSSAVTSLPSKREAQLAAAIDALAVARRAAGSRALRQLRQSTSFVRVSRSARNQAPQPERWYHHSRCTPATLRRK